MTLIPSIKVTVFFDQGEREMPVCEDAIKIFSVMTPLDSVVEFIEQQMSGHYRVDSYIIKMEWHKEGERF